MKRIFSLILILLLACSPALAGEVKAYNNTDPLPFSEDEELMKIYFLAIGSCDSFLIVCGDETMLIDAGTLSASKYVLSQLKALGITRINHAVNTHPHDDHIDGFNAVFEGIPVDKFYICYSQSANENMARALRTARKHNIEIVTIDDEYDLSFGGNTIKLFRDYQYSGINHRSLAMRVEYGDCSIFFAADLTRRAVKNLTADYGDELKSDILKMPHHGVTVPTYEFMKSVDPQVCVITNGDNRQASETVALLKKWKYARLFTLRNQYEFITNGEYWTCRHTYTNPDK